MGALDVGSVLADTYEVTRLIGRGGMGEVWLAKHRRLPGKQVAIKVLHVGGKPLTGDALTRFRREAEIATRINHPNIVEVHDFNTLPDGSPYLVLEFLQGESLASRLRHPMDVEEVKAILRQVGSALQAAHAHGVVHRDLKPDNIFLVQEPMGAVVKVLDFGISKVVDSQTLQTQDAVLVGTPAYMSPEQALGNNKDVGPQSDVFALGAIAYEMLTGAPPFSAQSVAQLVFRIAYEPHQPLNEARSGLPPSVVHAVERALLKDRTQRYPDMASFIEELTGAPLPVTRKPPESDEPSGVATPGMPSSESMMGATAAPTPVAPTPHALLVPPPALLPKAGGWRRMSFGVGLVLVAGLVAALFGPELTEESPPPQVASAWAPPPKPPTPTPEPPPMPSDPTPEPDFAPQDHGEAMISVKHREPEPAPAVPAASKKFPMPPADELAKLEELTGLMKAKRFADAVNVSDRTNRLELSPVGRSYAAMLITQANCGFKDQAVAKSRYRTITAPQHRVAAKKFCRAYLDTAIFGD